MLWKLERHSFPLMWFFFLFYCFWARIYDFPSTGRALNLGLDDQCSSIEFLRIRPILQSTISSTNKVLSALVLTIWMRDAGDFLAPENRMAFMENKAYCERTSAQRILSMKNTGCKCNRTDTPTAYMPWVLFMTSIRLWSTAVLSAESKASWTMWKSLCGRRKHWSTASG